MFLAAKACVIITLVIKLNKQTMHGPQIGLDFRSSKMILIDFNPQYLYIHSSDHFQIPDQKLLFGLTFNYPDILIWLSASTFENSEPPV